MTDDFHERHEAAFERAKERAAASGRGIGVAYEGPAAYEPRDGPPPGWRGVVTVTDGQQQLGILVTARSRSRHADFDAEALATAIEELGQRLGDGPPVDNLQALVAGGGEGIELEVHTPDDLRAIFP